MGAPSDLLQRDDRVSMPFQALETFAIHTLDGLLRRPVQPGPQASRQRGFDDLEPLAIRKTARHGDHDAIDSVLRACAVQAANDLEWIRPRHRLADTKRQVVPFGGALQRVRREREKTVEAGAEIEILAH